MKNSKFKVLYMLIMFSMIFLILLAGCTNGEGQDVDVTPDTWISSDEFTEIMEQHGANVTNMGEFSDSFEGIFIATDLDTHPMEIDFDDEYSYMIIFNSSDSPEEIEEEYLHLMGLLEREDKLTSELTEENGVIRYEFVSERLGYNLIVKAGNVLIQADGPEESRDLINSLIAALGF